MTMSMPGVWTVQQVAEYLAVQQGLVQQEFECGNIKGFKVGGEWRCFQSDVLDYMQAQRLKAGSPAGGNKDRSTPMTSDFTRIEPIDYRWPKRGGGVVLHYEPSYQTIRRIDDRDLVFRIGFASRQIAGKSRARIYVWLDKKPLVAFVGGDNYDNDGLLASLIKVKKRQLTPNEAIPSEYRSFTVKRYDSIVRGPHASGNMAVVVHKDDLGSMVNHAIIRAKEKNLI